MEYNFDLEGLKKGEWHGGLPAQLRLHFWFQESNMSAFEENHIGRKRALDRCYFEIKSKLNSTEREVCNDSRKKVENEINKLNNPTFKNKILKSPLGGYLDDYEEKVRDYADKHGLTNPDRQDPSRAILN